MTEGTVVAVKARGANAYADESGLGFNVDFRTADPNADPPVEHVDPSVLPTWARDAIKDWLGLVEP